MLPTTELRLAGPSLRLSRHGLVQRIALVLGFAASGRRVAAAAPEAPAGPFQGYVAIGADDSVTVWSAPMDLGQGCSTGTAMLVAEELGCDRSKVRVEGGSGDPGLYGNLASGGAGQGTGGSTAMASSWKRYRKADAAALGVAWDESAAECRGTAELRDLYREALDQPGAAVAVRAATGRPIRVLPLRRADLTSARAAPGTRLLRRSIARSIIGR